MDLSMYKKNKDMTLRFFAPVFLMFFLIFLSVRILQDMRDTVIAYLPDMGPTVLNYLKGTPTVVCRRKVHRAARRNSGAYGQRRQLS